ncbi:MAG: glycosyltransferase family 39 protein [Candidatus Kapabacteria bacterium]|nr:MAG: hypothetical protein UZ07_CHB004000680 [Chlorobi bacterium OLB7]MBX7216879.1 glycosyltransferase family 39 protein [Candidatus Kapabacteria bacterium]
MLIAFVLFADMPLRSDAAGYSKQAIAMSANFPGTEPFYWPPALPSILAAAYTLFGQSLAVARVTNILLLVLMVYGVILVATQATNDERKGRIAGWMAALYPASFLMAGQTYSQHLTAVGLLFAAYWLMLAYRRGALVWYLLAGIALGVAAVTRASPMSLLPALAIVAAVAYWRLRDQQTPAAIATRKSLMPGAALFLVGTGLLVMPAMYHNVQHGAGWSISTKDESNVLVGNCKYTHHYKTSHLASDDFALMEPEVREYLIRMRELPDARNAMMREAVNYVIDHPGITAWRTLSRIRAFWGFDYMLSREIQNQYQLSNLQLLVPLSLEAGGYVIVMIGVLLGLFFARDQFASPALPLLLVMAISYQVPYMLAFAAGTYHFPVVFLLLPIACVGWGWALQSWRMRWPQIAQRRWFWAAVALFALVQIEYGYWAIALR